MKWNSLVRRIITCAVAAATIATASPAYVFAEDEAEIVAIEDENEAIVQDTEEPADDAIFGEDDCSVRFSWDHGLKVTVVEPADIAGEVKAGNEMTVKKGTSVRFKIEPTSRRYKVLSVKCGDVDATQNSDGSYSVVISEPDSGIRIEIESRFKVTFAQPDNEGKIACTPTSGDYEPLSPWPGYVYVKPNGTIRWIYKPDKGYSVTKVTKVEGSKEIELKPVEKPVKEDEVGIFELKNVNEDVTIRRYSKKDEEEPTFDHKLTLSNESDYNSVVINGKNVYKGESVGFNDGDSIVITGLGKGDSIDTKNWSTYFVKWTYKGNKESGYEYGDGYRDDKIGGLFALNNLTEDIELTVQGRRIPVNAITAKGKTEESYTVTATAASKKGDYINLTKHKADTKVTFATKKTGSIDYEIASDAAGVKYGIAEVELVSLTKEKNGYSFEIPFGTLAGLAYSENPKVEFTTAVVAKLPAPTAKVSASTDIDATLTLGLPKAASGLTGLWYKVEGKANVPKGKSLPEGMAGEVGPLYVPATVTTLPVYLMAEEGKQYGDGTAQKYDFTATLLQLENQPIYTDKPLTDKTEVEGADGGNVVGVSPEKKFSGTTKKPGYEEKLGLKKVKPAFILGEDEVTLATAKFSAKTTPAFRTLELVEITDASGAVVRTSDTEDDSEMITIDGDTIILEDSAGLTPGGKYTLSVWPKSKTGGKNAKPATLKLTVKQGIDELSLTVPQQSYVKKAKKAITIKPTVIYNGGPKAKKTPAVKKVNWELLDAAGNALTDASPLYGKVTINQKNGTVTVAKDLVVSGDPSVYSFRIMATAADYEGNTTAAKSDVIELVSDEVKTDIQPVEMEIEIEDATGVKESDLHFFSGVEKKSDGKWYINGEEIFMQISDEKFSERWGVSLEGANTVAVYGTRKQGEEWYYHFDRDYVRKVLEGSQKIILKVYTR